MDDLMEYLTRKISIEELLIYIIIGICIWLLIREVKTWYWKINELLSNQEEQTEIMRKILNELTNEQDELIEENTNEESEEQEESTLE